MKQLTKIIAINHDENLIISNVGFKSKKKKHNNYDVSFLIENNNTLQGICHNKFKADIHVSNFSLDIIDVGTMLQLNECLLEVVSIGKKCHTNCQIINEQAKCSLKNFIFYTKVIQGGMIARSDIITYSTKKRG